MKNIIVTTDRYGLFYKYTSDDIESMEEMFKLGYILFDETIGKRIWILKKYAREAQKW